MEAKVKITVLRRLFQQDLIDEYGEAPWEPCERPSEGKEFVSQGVRLVLFKLERI